MPGPYTYPGVYIEEIPSGVHTISGVSTSITVFAGWTDHGPVNHPLRVRNFSEYTRRFGGLDLNSELGYAVRQFFRNGGSEAWILRIAADTPASTKASADLTVPDDGPAILHIEALETGTDGNAIEIRVDYNTPLPESTFNLTFISNLSGDPAMSEVETFRNLSMNDDNPQFVERVVNGTSRLVKVTSLYDAEEMQTTPGFFETGPLSDLDHLLVGQRTTFLLQINGLPPLEVILSSADVAAGDDEQRLVDICTTIKKHLDNEPDPAWQACTCRPDQGRIRITSTTGGLNSWVRILPSPHNDVSSRLMINRENGARVEDAAGQYRPAPQPGRGKLTSGALGTIPEPDTTKNKFDISLDGQRALTVTIPTGPLSDAPPGKRADLATRIQKAVRQLRPDRPAYSGFTCTVEGNKLVLTSGTTGIDPTGSASAVLVSPAADNDIAADLKLLPGVAEESSAVKNFLEGGFAQKFDPNSPYQAFAPPNARGGLYALDDVDLFNLLCLPGITDPATLDEASDYCKRRRAFLIIDAPQNTTIEQVESQVLPNLPKSAYAALYYPWVEVDDPLNNGRPRPCPPSGTIAGVYARTDSERGVWKAPAGIEANLAGVRKLERLLTDEENGTLNMRGVNCLRAFTPAGIVAWGARTMRGDNDLTDEYKYVPVRRIALFIEESLYRGLKWVVFEPNDEPLWAQIRLNVGSFMHDLFRQGAFQGKTPREAYLVKCDSETTTQSDINNGIVNILVQFAPLKPAEFVVLRIQQKAGQVAV
jgi:phage tail sheath protein FI